MENTVNKPRSRGKFSVRELTYTGLFTVLIALCSWISVPSAVPFTLQTFGVFAALGLLGGRNGFFAILVYVILGAVGVPVFAEFSSGFGVLAGPTGGYITGFIAMAAVYWLITDKFGYKIPVMIIAMVIGLAVLYALGTVQFMLVYSATSEPIGFAASLGFCVLPFIVPDLVKMGSALFLTERLKKYVKL